MPYQWQVRITQSLIFDNNYTHDIWNSTYSAPCDAGYDFIAYGAEGGCYKLSSELKNYGDAKASCEAAGAVMSSINSEAEKQCY